MHLGTTPGSILTPLIGKQNIGRTSLLIWLSHYRISLCCQISIISLLIFIQIENTDVTGMIVVNSIAVIRKGQMKANNQKSPQCDKQSAIKDDAEHNRTLAGANQQQSDQAQETAQDFDKPATTNPWLCEDMEWSLHLA